MPNEAVVKLKFGGSDLNLAKSDTLIAVKPQPGMEKKADAAVRSSTPVQQITNDRLGGFKIVEVNSTSTETNEALDRLRHDPAIATGSHVFHTSDDGVPFVPTGTLFIVFKDGTSQAQQEKLIGEHSLQILEARGDNEFLTRVTSDSPNPVKVAAALQQSNAVEVCEPELATPGKLTAFSVPNGGLLREQWHLHNEGKHRGTTIGFLKGADSRVVAAWQAAQTLGSPLVVVAVIDDAVDLTHPDLSGPGKIVHPWDFTRRTNDPSPNAETGDWHGTACAGVAVGRSGGSGIYGAAPGATLMPVRWGLNLSDGQVEQWFKYVTDRGAWVVSCSWGAQARHFPLSTRQKRAIEKCATQGRGGKGCVVVFAAGNENRNINDPTASSVNGFAIHPNVIAVAASTSMDVKSNYSNFGSEISVCAPSNGAGGWGILTTDVTGTGVVNGVTVDLGYDPGSYTYEFGGTSSACPLVAGICALVLSVNPSLTAADVRSVVTRTARRLNGQKGHTSEHGHGCIDAEAAVNEAASLGGLVAGNGPNLSDAA